MRAKLILMLMLAGLGAWAQSPQDRVVIDAWRYVRSADAYDTDTITFAAESGATDLRGIDAIVRYVKAENLWTNFVIYPMKSAQNAGSGATVYSLGGLTTNDMTLVNAPSWTTTGVVFTAASSQYGRINDFIGSQILTVFYDYAQNPLASANVNLISQYNFSENKRSWLLIYAGAVAGDPYRLARTSDGTSTYSEIYNTTDEDQTTARQTLVCQWTDGGRFFWQNKAQRTLTLTSGESRPSRYDADSPVLINAINSSSPSGFASGNVYAVAFVINALTTEQRESLTDLINAL